ncbi:hypothetical protein NDU88_002015 [Pleurodeles waltl]|uniref:Uncharacterized protein n=1 Tax=Pleurodeles waltl TaxID=8319 RepID=A0AAV7VBD3_PLEWA|nr:hypothetical protein NDU88_002015 [Pleurodeles waltl]
MGPSGSLGEGRAQTPSTAAAREPHQQASWWGSISARKAYREAEGRKAMSAPPPSIGIMRAQRLPLSARGGKRKEGGTLLAVISSSVEYVPGRCNTIADALSQLLIDDGDDGDKDGECDVAFMYEDVLLGMGPSTEVEHGLITEQEWEREMMRDVEM